MPIILHILCWGINSRWYLSCTGQSASDKRWLINYTGVHNNALHEKRHGHGRLSLATWYTDTVTFLLSYKNLHVRVKYYDTTLKCLFPRKPTGFWTNKHLHHRTTNGLEKQNTDHDTIQLKQVSTTVTLQ